MVSVVAAVAVALAEGEDAAVVDSAAAADAAAVVVAVAAAEGVDMRHTRVCRRGHSCSL